MNIKLAVSNLCFLITIRKTFVFLDSNSSILVTIKN